MFTLADDDPVIVPTPSPSDQQLAELFRQIADLERQLAEERNRPEASPTPAPVFAPNPRLLSPQNIAIEPGETQDVTITQRNIGTHTASNVLTQAVGDGPFTVEFLNNSNSVNSIGENRDATMTLRITADTTADPGTHTITLNNSFRNQARENMNTTDRLSVRIGGAVSAPNVRLGNFRMGGAVGTVAPIAPGQTFVVTAGVQNLGTASARDVQISLPNMDADTIFFTGDLNQAFFATMEGGYSGTVNFTFQTASRIDSGTYPIEFVVNFRDENGNAQDAETFTFFVNVHSDDDDALANLEIRGMTAPTGTVQVDQTATITFYLYNSGETEARNIRVEASPESAQAIVPVVTASTQSVSSLAPGESRQLTFHFSPREAAMTRSYAIGFNVQFEEGRGQDTTSHSFEQFAAINVYNPSQEDDDENRIQIPRIIVSSYSVYPRIPLAGQTFEMEVTFQNTSATRSVNNIVITLEALEAVRDQGTVFSPAEGSNTMFIDYIPPRGEVSRTMTWFTVPDASPRSYPLRVSFVYQDQDFREFSFEENLNINVQQVVRLEISEMRIPSNVMVGSGIFLDMQIMNTGMVQLRNMRVRVDGPFDTSEANMFISNIGPGAFRSYSGVIIPLEAGTLEGSFVVYGEDATGAVVEFLNDFTVEVMGGFDDMGMGFDREFGMGDGFIIGDVMFAGGGMIWEDGGFGDSWGDPWGEEEVAGFLAFIQRTIVWISIVMAVIIITIVTIVIVRRKRNRIDFDDDL